MSDQPPCQLLPMHVFEPLTAADKITDVVDLRLPANINSCIRV